MRLIDADTLIPKEVHTIIRLTATGEQTESVVYADQIDNTPTVDAVERKTGKWVGEGYREPLYDIEGVKTWGGVYRCSECGFIHTAIQNNGCYHFCPNCGAEMRGEANEDRTC